MTQFAVRTMGKSKLGKLPQSLAGALCVLSRDPVIGPMLIEAGASRFRPPRHPTRYEPPFLELTGVL
jgi:hypothetical protein